MKYKNIIMDRVQYEGHDYESYSLEAQKVTDVLNSGDIPEITLAEKNVKNRPVVATILAQWKNPNRTEKDYFITPFYVDAVKNAGGYPVFIAFDKIQEQLEHFNPDAILLIGGDFDFPADWYVNLDKEVSNFKRNDAYQSMLSYADKNKLPVLGICGGEQALAGYLGAKIRTNINKDKNNIQIDHRPGGAKLIHTVSIDENSKLFDVVKQNDFMVTSVHHEAIDKDNLGQTKAVATAPDGTVEAIEPISPWNDFVIGVQWHPERWATMDNVPSKNLFNGFIESATLTKNRKLSQSLALKKQMER